MHLNKFFIIFLFISVLKLDETAFLPLLKLLEMKGSMSVTGKYVGRSNRGHRRAFSVPNPSSDRTRIGKSDFPVIFLEFFFFFHFRHFVI